MIITVNGSRVENLLFLLKQSAGKDGKHDPEKIIYIEDYVENESDRDQAGTCHFSVIKMKREKESSKQECLMFTKPQSEQHYVQLPWNSKLRGRFLYNEVWHNRFLIRRCSVVIGTVTRSIRITAENYDNAVNKL